MAYIIGSFIGKTPFSSISPKKTWEGTLGGALLCVASAWTIANFFQLGIPTIVVIVFALIAAVFGTLGDLLESKLKRMAQVKDSGAIMPGHGGALDRFDSLLLAAPVAALFIYYFFNN
jgi:phosphatidate cytidylyltransferase